MSDYLHSDNLRLQEPLPRTPPPTHSNLKNPQHYQPGDGDYTAAPQRPGSDHSWIKSKGNLT